MTHPRKRTIVWCLSALLLPALVRADDPQATCTINCLDELTCMDACELLQLYGCAEAGPYPVGFGKGEVLCMPDTRLAKVRTRLANVLWKGKHFEECGYFINQWAGFRALHSCAESGPSYHDGKPAWVLEYPPGTPLFANMHDEVRQVGPCLYLGLAYERCPCPRLRAIFAMEMQPEKPSKRCKHPCICP